MYFMNLSKNSDLFVSKNRNIWVKKYLSKVIEVSIFVNIKKISKKIKGKSKRIDVKNLGKNLKIGRLTIRRKKTKKI